MTSRQKSGANCQRLAGYETALRQGLAIQNRAAAIKILAERRAGALLQKVQRAQGKRGDGLRLTLSQSEISEATARRWQKMAAVPEAKVRELEASLVSEQDSPCVWIPKPVRLYNSV